MKLNPRQKQIVEAREQNVIVIATAGSGKTRTLTERIKYVLNERKADPKKIVALTFTNFAAHEMKERIGKLSEEMYIGTIHSYAAKIAYANSHIILYYIHRRQFDKILEKAVMTSKLPDIYYLFVDEAQDLTNTEVKFLNHLNAKNNFYVGDPRQCIYDFLGANVNIIRQMTQNPKFKVYFLNNNYRNAREIIKFSNSLLYSFNAFSPSPTPVRKIDGIVDVVKLEEALEELQYNGHWGKWAILVRCNKERAAIAKMLREREIPFTTFKRSELNEENIETLYKCDKVKLLTCHASKGLEFSYVIAVGFLSYEEEERRIAYVAATRAKDVLYWVDDFCMNRRYMDRKLIEQIQIKYRYLFEEMKRFNNERK